MASNSDFLEQAQVDNVIADYATMFVSLHTGSPLDNDTGGNEVSGSGYARTAVTFVRTDSYMDNSGIVAFPETTAPWGTVSHFAVYDASTGGNLLFHEALTAPAVTGSLETLSFPIGSLVYTVD